MAIADSPRVIPIFLISGGRLVKTVSFSAPAYLGDPINSVRILNEKEADELIVLDISATRQSKAPDFQLIERLASEAFMPVTYGGGIRSADDAGSLLGLGIEKVAFESLSMKTPTEVQLASEWFGAQAVVGILTTTGQGSTLQPMWPGGGNSLQSRLRSLTECGVGEIVHYDADRDGTRQGYNYPAIREIAGNISVPLVAAGGAGSQDDFLNALRSGASAVAAGSLFSQHGKRLASLISYPERHAIEDLTRRLNQGGVVAEV